MSLKLFTIPMQDSLSSRGFTQPLAELAGARDPIFKDKFVKFLHPIPIYKGAHIRIVGPNGIGKSTLLNDLFCGQLKDSFIHKEAVVGYYKQDFSSLNFDDTVRKTLFDAAENGGYTEQEVRKIGAQFFVNNDTIRQTVGSLSEGQKGLLALACLVLKRPAVLIVDEPTNHINFR